MTWTAPTYQLHNIPNGAAGIRETLKRMEAFTRKYKSAPLIRELALSLTQNLPQKDWAGEASAILKFVQDQIRYVMDVAGVETLQSPIQTLRLASGDCDDKSVLAATLLQAINHPVKFVAVGREKGRYTHVFPQTKIGQKWLTMETTEIGWPLGKTPSPIKSYMVQHVRN